jgi:hypothetical protein
MANIYVKHTGSNVSPYNSWATAATTLQAAIAIATTSDTVFVSSMHTQSTAGFVGSGGVFLDYMRIISVSDASEPPTTLQSGAVINVTSGNLLLDYRGVYVYGINFSSTGTFRASSGEREGNVTYEMCGIEIKSGAKMVPGAMQRGTPLFKNCVFKFLGTSSYIENPYMRITGGSVASGSLAPSNGFFGNGTCKVSVDGFDFSNMPSSINMHNSNEHNVSVILRNCRLPASWSGVINAGTTYQNDQTYAMYNCDSADTNYRLRIEYYGGVVSSETAITRTGGASDGVTPLSWKMSANGNCSYFTSEISSPEIVVWNDATGTAKTITVEVLTDNVTLTDAECWLEVQYLGTSGFPLGSFITDARANVLATASNQTTSTEAWATTGLTTPVKQKLSVTFTPQEKGFVHAKVMLAKPSTTVYVCPKASVT